MPPRPLPDFLLPDPAAHEYPRPQLARPDWWSLNGTWAFALDPKGRWREPDDVTFDRQIVVPFAPETPASGVEAHDFFLACWYRRSFDAPPLEKGERLHLHFGAVDYIATVWVNGVRLAHHEGGYTPFSLDVTDVLREGEPQVIVLCAEDDPADLAKPRGKQDWQREPHSIWYQRTSGIWQTVWMERVSTTHITEVRWTSSLERWEVGLDLSLAGDRREGLRVKVRLTARGQLLADDTYQLVAGEVHRRIALSDPGIDDFRNELLWRPEQPTLIDAEIELWGERGERLDAVRSYTAIRQFAVQGDRFVLNGRPYHLRLVLDQGYWEHTGLTAPTDAALRRDVIMAKAMGFNGVRKHQKIEDPRYLYWADRLGLLVWEEMPSPYRFTPRAIERLTTQWLEIMRRDVSHPCIMTWVPFNESWGVPDLPAIAEQRHWVEALYHLTRTYDTTRPVVGNDGWESVATDIMGIHDYDHDPERIRRRYRPDVELPQIFARERPGHRILVLNDVESHAKLPVVLSEFGGIAYAADEDRTWGYSRCHSAEEFQKRYTALMEVVNAVGLFAGYCYTQFTDTYQEANGLLFMDRTPKFDLTLIDRATRGDRDPGPEPGVPGGPAMIVPELAP
jgi:beta-galactosidase/beta-glucuronidase